MARQRMPMGKSKSQVKSDNAAAAQAGHGLSLIVPAFNEAGGLAELHRRLSEVAGRLKQARGLRVEVVYVDDGSRDATLSVARNLPAKGLDVQVVSLSRNFGKEAALLAGLDHARHGAVLFMDGDGQHPPALLERLVGHWLDDGYDVVYTAKAHRDNESALRRAAVKAFYAILNWNARHRIPEDAGFRQLRVDYNPAERAHGQSAWSLRSLIGLSIEGLTSFTVAPLRIASLLGILLAVSAIVFSFYIVIETWLFGRSVPGYPSLFVGMMILGGVQLIMIGVMGEYIGKILSELKARPVYFVAEHSVKAAEDEAADSPSRLTAAE